MAIYLSDSQAKPATEDRPETTEARRRRDPEATRKAILDAAEDLFVELGPAATSLSRVASG